MLALLPAAFVMALIGFMEATAVSKALAAKSRQRIDTNKELVGQGLANIVGAFFQSYVVSGSFSRSAVAGRAGAKTGLFAVVSALVVLVVLLFLTPYLYHLPQAVLAMIVMMAVFGLIRISPLVHAWKVQRSDVLAGLTTFVATLAFAPDIANGILIGMGLTAALFLLRTMKPRTAVLGRKADGTMGGIDANDLEPLGRQFVAMRFDRSLNYLNVAAFEDTVLEVLARYPEARGILVIGSGINEIDASGEDKVRELAQSLKQQGVVLMFSSLKAQVADVFERAGLIELLGPDKVFPSKEVAVEQARRRFDLAPA
jgi:MFS superfamily sulfate permease-like transporter